MLVAYFGYSCFRHSFWTPDLSLSLSSNSCFSASPLRVCLLLLKHLIPSLFEMGEQRARRTRCLVTRCTTVTSERFFKFTSGTYHFHCGSNCGAISVDLFVWSDEELHAWRLPPPALWGAVDTASAPASQLQSLKRDCTYISSHHIFLPLSQRKVLFKNAESRRMCVWVLCIELRFVGNSDITISKN